MECDEARPAGPIVTLSIFRFDRPANRFWALAQMGLARRAIAASRDLTFFKLLGTGTGAGFHPVPNLSVYAVLAVWRNASAADRAFAECRPLAGYRRRAAEWVRFDLAPIRVRGAWSGSAPFAIDPDRSAPLDGPVAVLTRATLKPHHLHRFWRRVPAISEAILRQPDLRFQIGLGEVPWLHQVTFSIWDDAARMRAFAMHSPSHGEAVRAVRRQGWFREQLFARFVVIGAVGRWHGADAAALLAQRQVGRVQAVR